MIRSKKYATTRRFGIVLWIIFGAVITVGTVAGQGDDDAPDADSDEPLRTESGECFTASDVVDWSVLNDRSIYVRTRARHFLLNTRQQCNNLRRAYTRNAIRFEPFGRRICPNDGSHLMYETGGRARLCPVGLITEVNDRDEARELAEIVPNAQGDDVLIFRELDPTEP